MAVAVTETDVPSSNVPPSVTLPPSLAVTVNVYWVTTGSGGEVWTVLVGACVSSSLEQKNKTRHNE